MTFVDTSAWFAFFVPDDPEHQRIRAWFSNAQPRLLTSDYVIDETLTLLAARHRSTIALAAGSAFFEKHLAAIHFVDAAQIHRAWNYFQQRSAAGWSFTDCTSKVVIDDLQISAAAALDEHFRQFGNVVVMP